MRQHEDSTRPAWTPAELHTDEALPRALVTLPDLVRQQMQAPALLPWKLAATHVLDALEHAHRPAFFVARSGLRARPVTDADVWRESFPSGAEHLQEEIEGRQAARSSGLVRCPTSWESISAAEARARGLQLAADGRGPELSDEALELLPRLPALQGAAGLLSWLRHEWVTLGHGPDCLDIGAAGRVAMLQADADTLFGCAESAPDDLAGNEAATNSAAGRPWGLALAEGTALRGVPLVRLADAVRELAPLAPMSPARMVALLAERLDGPGSLPLYLLQHQPSAYAQPVSDATVFEKGVTAVAGGLAPVRGRQPWSATQWGGGQGQPFRMVAKRAAKPELRGRAGALAILRDLAGTADFAKALDSRGRMVSWLALRSVDVATIARELRGEVPQSLRLVVSTEAETATVPNNGRAAGRAAGRYTRAPGLPSDAEIWKAHKALQESGDKSPTKTLSNQYGVHRSTVQRACDKYMNPAPDKGRSKGKGLVKAATPFDVLKKNPPLKEPKAGRRRSA